ncbi:HtaA domain-containing protein [Microbacterium suwonense]|nr:HtaA domain-containing protein [Microbacterium suwonense]
MTRGLTWNVKDSLLAYVSRLADGAVLVDGGAEFTADGSIRFPHSPVANDDGAASGPTFTFSGSLTLSGHDELLHISIEGPAVSVMGDEIEVSGVDALTGMRVTIALGTVTSRRETDDDLVVEASSLALQESATELFAHQYPLGTILSPLLMCVPLRRPV